jgi:hypothetical protein
LSGENKQFDTPKSEPAISGRIGKMRDTSGREGRVSNRARFVTAAINSPIMTANAAAIGLAYAAGPAIAPIMTLSERQSPMLSAPRTGIFFVKKLYEQTAATVQAPVTSTALLPVAARNKRPQTFSSQSAFLTLLTAALPAGSGRVGLSARSSCKSTMSFINKPAA